MKKKIIALLPFLLFTSVVRAETVANPITTTLQEKKEEIRQQIQEKRLQLITKRCERIEKRIEARVTHFNNKKEKHVARYNRLKERLARLGARLQEKGYDITQIQADLRVLDEKIKQWASDYALFINKLEETKNLACGESQDTFKEALKEARRQLQLVHQNSREIHEFYQTVIRVDIQALKNQKVEEGD